MRASMGKSRLSCLALFYIHYDTVVDLDRVVDCYARVHPVGLNWIPFSAKFVFSLVNYFLCLPID